MDKQFVPYELAVKLKELGFDEPCIAYYNKDKEFCWTDLTENPKGLINHKLLFPNAPLWQQAFDWFREKYGLFHFEDHRCNSHNGNSKTYWFGIKQFKEAPFGSIVKVGLIELGCFKAYESARLACLEKLIELTTPQLEDK